VTPERRRHRSKEILEAIHLHLQAVKERLDAAAVWVADEDGLLLGASEAPMDGDALAAYTPIPGRLGEHPDEQMGILGQMKHLEGHHTVVREFEVDGLPLLLGLATEDPPRDDVQDELDLAIQGVIRILAEPSKDRQR